MIAHMEANATSEFVYKPKSNVPAAILAKEQANKASVPDVVHSLPVAIIPNADEQAAYDAILAQVSKDAGLPGVMFAEPLRARAGCLAAALGALIVGGTWEAVRTRTGIEFLTLDLLAKADKPGLGALLRAALTERDRRIVDRLRGAVMDRAINGVDEPVIGRVAKDQDGIITTRKRHSDKLAEFALSRLDRPTFGEQPAATNIGQQVIYNLQGASFGAPASPRQSQPAQDAEIVDTGAEAGENPAKIDLDSLPQLDNT
jgi:hypothetical protein